MIPNTRFLKITSHISALYSGSLFRRGATELAEVTSDISCICPIIPLGHVTMNLRFSQRNIKVSNVCRSARPHINLIPILLLEQHRIVYTHWLGG
jgi:hypothetical protein